MKKKGDFLIFCHLIIKKKKKLSSQIVNLDQKYDLINQKPPKRGKNGQRVHLKNM